MGTSRGQGVYEIRLTLNGERLSNEHYDAIDCVASLRSHAAGTFAYRDGLPFAQSLGNGLVRFLRSVD